MLELCVCVCVCACVRACVRVSVRVCLTFSVPFRRHLSSALCFNKLSLGKKFICKVERLNVKQRKSR